MLTCTKHCGGFCRISLTKSWSIQSCESLGVSEFLCKRFGLQWLEMRSPNWMVNRVKAAFQSRMGIVHFWLMLRRAR